MKTNKQTSKLHEPISLPESFLERHVCQHHLMALFGWTEPEFWQLYTAGRLPLGVNFMPLVKMPLIVFRTADVEAWNTAGRPAQPGALELQSSVLHDLMDCCRADGVQFPDDIAKAN